MPSGSILPSLSASAASAKLSSAKKACASSMESSPLLSASRSATIWSSSILSAESVSAVYKSPLAVLKADSPLSARSSPTVITSSPSLSKSASSSLPNLVKSTTGVILVEPLPYVILRSITAVDASTAKASMPTKPICETSARSPRYLISEPSVGFKIERAILASFTVNPTASSLSSPSSISPLSFRSSQ